MNLKDYPRMDDPLRETKLDRRNTKIRRRRMRQYRAVPVAHRVWWVTLTATWADREQFSDCELPRGLTFTPTEFWCNSRRKAKALVEADQRAGGAGTMYPVEFRRCAVCEQPLLGPQAQDYRLKQEKPRRFWQYPQGPMCNLSCKPPWQQRKEKAKA
jgi:hypothetical protein